MNYVYVRKVPQVHISLGIVLGESRQQPAKTLLYLPLACDPDSVDVT